MEDHAEFSGVNEATNPASARPASLERRNTVNSQAALTKLEILDMEVRMS